jgi:hypothetical protein
MTMYARQVNGNSRIGGSAIRPVGYDIAEEWAEKNLDPEIVLQEFEIVEA